MVLYNGMLLVVAIGGGVCNGGGAGVAADA